MSTQFGTEGIVREVFLRSVARLGSHSLSDQVRQRLSTHPVFARAESCLRKIQNSRLSEHRIREFFNSWRATHFTSDVTGGIAESLKQSDASGRMSTAVSHVQRIANEDDGHFGGEAHGDLFDRMAQWACGRADWESGDLQSGSTRAFCSWVSNGKTSVSESSEVLSAILAFELFHRGECELAAEIFCNKAMELGLSETRARKICEYPIVHGLSAAEENKENLDHALAALRSYYAAKGEEFNAEEVIDHLETFYSRLETVFREAEERLVH